MARPTSSIFVLIVLSASLGIALAGKLPPEFKRCARTDPQFSECLRDAVESALPKLKNGLPKLGLPPLDPLRIEKLQVSQGNKEAPVNVELTFDNFYTSQLLDGVKFSKVELDLDSMTIHAAFTLPRATVTSNYTVRGRVLLLPINGSGGSKLITENFTSDLHMRGKKIIMKDGKEYMNITHAELKMEPKFMQIQLDNLFNGDEQLSKAMNRVLNENWHLVYNEIGPSFSEAYAQVFKQHTGSLFLRVALEDLFPNKL